MSIREELEKFLLSELAVDKKSITADENLLTQGIIDSMGILKLSTFIEDKFGIQMTDEEMVPENFQSLISLENYIESKKKG